MTREQARKWFQSHKTSDTMVNEAYDLAIEALSEPINCVKCKHYYETEDDTGVHGYCRMDTAHTDLISRADAIDAVAEEWLSEASAESPYVNDYDIDKYRELAEDFFKDIPSADAVSREAHYDAVANRITDMEERGFVSVVRCKDCRYYKSDGGAMMVCDVSDIVVNDDDFCSYGERREESEVEE